MAVNLKNSGIENNTINLRSTICLNMIVKNESHIILDTLKNLSTYIKFDYWVISDTGSTDGTQEIIKTYFKEQNIEGELFEDKWKNFGYNRTKAIVRAIDKADYIFFFDADDLIYGNFEIPKVLDKDCYNVKFEINFSYKRIILVSNRKIICRYDGVLHENLVILKTNFTCDLIHGDYHFQSRHLGSRSMNPTKYIDDGNILEVAFENEVTNVDLKYRYAYYCAQSFLDSGKHVETAIKWFKKYLTLPACQQYKYCACINLGHIYMKLDNIKDALYYYGETYNYDSERIEGITYIMGYYHNINHHFMVNALWHKFKNFNRCSDNKIFLDYDRYRCFEWTNIVSAFYAQDLDSGYDSCKRSIRYNENIPNILQNLMFYREQLRNDSDPILKKFLIDTINEIGKLTNYNDIELWKKYELCIKDYSEDKWNELSNKFNCTNITKSNEYSVSKNILIYTGYMNFLWNDSTIKTNSIGGSEKAVAYLSNYFPKDYTIFISGDVKDEQIDNVIYINSSHLQNLLDNNTFHSIIISRYLDFFCKYNNIKCYNLTLWAHDTSFHSHPPAFPKDVISKYYSFIDNAIVQTNWHKQLFLKKYPLIKDKLNIINNGIDITTLSKNPSKIKNKFIWSSCSERGLNILLKLWPEIIKVLPDSTLDICSYNKFPKNDEDIQMQNIINSFDNIIHHGKLNSSELYILMQKSEYWLYTTNWLETSCITGMEMLMNEVICIYYPVAGLVDTLSDCGIQVKNGNEIETILNLTEERKGELRERGTEYALTCSWENRSKQWSELLGLDKKIWIFYYSQSFKKEMVQKYIENLNYIYQDYCIYLSSDKNIIITQNPSKITFIYDVFDTIILNELPNTQFSFLNTEPLNIPVMLEHTINILKLHPNFEYYDYSKSNLQILKENSIDIDCKIYLQYYCRGTELQNLIELNKNTKKVFDFGIMKTLGGEITERRLKIVNFLKENNFTVNIIGGWENERDKELAKCNMILNIHGNLNTEMSNIFEHIRCDRLLAGGFNILSETSYKLDQEYINTQPNLKLIEYNDFFNIKIIIECYNNKLCTIIHNKYVLDILNNTSKIINIPMQHITFLENLRKDFNPNNMIIYDIGSSVLHWTENASNIWKNSNIYLFDGMTEMKLFYDEYNDKNNTNYKYNIGVLCDEDYKRINFYQNNELSGGNSYYKEIGHSNSSKIFTENHIKHKIGMRLETVVENKEIPLPDLIKIDVQGAELDILKGSMNVINHAKFLIVELQHSEYNEGAPLCNITCDFLIENGWQVYAEKFSNNGPDADWCFINTKHICQDISSDQKKIKYIYDELCLNKNPFNYYLNPVDIYEHLPILYKYSTECDSILESGVRASVSSWAFVYGLMNNNNNNNKKLILNDIEVCNIDVLLETTQNISKLNISYEWISNLDLNLKDSVDLTFIDTWHVGGHLKKELAKFSKLTNKYIIMHDTTVDEFTSEAVRANLSEEKIQQLSFDSGLSVTEVKMGLWPAVEDFLKNNNDWILHERFTNNNGLTILKKCYNKSALTIIDCFTFYNELELLNYRLNILNEYVDYFVLVEAAHTHTGTEKPLFYQDNKEMFEKFNHKIIHIIVDDFPHKYPNIDIGKEEQWINEKFQRNCISRGLDKLTLNDEDIITITDLDEIPNPQLFKKIKTNEAIIDTAIIEQDLYYYNLNCKMDIKWSLSKIISYKKYKELGFSCEQIRQNMSFKIIKNAGWHLSYFGDENFIKNKIEKFGHQEYNNDNFTNEDKIKERINNKIDLYDRPINIINIKIEDNNNLPPQYDIYLKNFYTKF